MNPLFCSFLLLLACNLYGQSNTIHIDDAFTKTSIKPYTTYCVEPLAGKAFFEKGAWNLKHVLPGQDQPVFDQFDGERKSWYFSNMVAVYWLKFTVTNDTDKPQELLLQLSHTTIIRSQLYTVGASGIDSTMEAGNIYPFSHRPVMRADFDFPLILKPGESRVCYFPFINCLYTHFDGLLYLWKRNAYEVAATRYDHMVGFGVGMIALYAIVTLVVTLLIPSRIHLLFLLYIANLLVYFATVHHLSFVYLWPNNPFMNVIVIILSFVLNIVLITLMMKTFLKTKIHFPVIDKILSVLIVVMCCCCMLPWTELLINMPIHFLAERIINVMFIPLVLMLCYISIRSVKRTRAESLFFMAFLLITLSVFLLPQLNFYGITNVPPEWITLMALPMFCLEAVVFMCFFSYRLYTIYKENHHIKVTIQQQEAHARLREREVEVKTMISTQEAERRRISRDLHDDIGTRLTALKMNLASLEERLTLHTTPDPLLLDSMNIIDDTLLDVRKMIVNLSPTVLEECGLVAAVKGLVTRLNMSGKMDVDFVTFGLPDFFPDELATTLYRIIQELLSNALKHSRATKVTVQLGCRDNTLFVMVEDDGHGFLQEQTSKGYGLSNLRSRVNILHGHWQMESQPGHGTSVLIEIPYAVKTETHAVEA
ncbi:sensor histidine kinase [Chryseolinea lacunae]|uniref:Oxygen sensor histidine kinase NreB n=1 Tax=Chryseolinea lacunae TaxID=2801331 RepID=A0ABS1KSF1_9BACT|nr:7TM-DISM domain-containing protein [Chryseolinea lacunae]MBL0742294.1 hypothetical protein [Chryseolinea lacunae]